MEDKHRHRLLADFPGETKFLPIEVLHIPDDYQFMDPELIELIRSSAEPFIDAADYEGLNTTSVWSSPSSSSLMIELIVSQSPPANPAPSIG